MPLGTRAAAGGQQADKEKPGSSAAGPSANPAAADRTWWRGLERLYYLNFGMAMGIAPKVCGSGGRMHALGVLCWQVYGLTHAAGSTL